MPFRDIAGHRRLLSLAASAAMRGTLPPSLMFVGPDGVGKRLAAVALAQTLNCPTPVPFGNEEDSGGFRRQAEENTPLDACGTCPSCLRIARNVHADVLIVEPGDTGSIKVDQIREAIERSAFRPFEGRRRVVIVDTADALVPEAQNALLKTLEEPPPSSVFVLVTSRPELLLPTVRSRCQRLRFGRLSPGEVAEVLMTAHGYEPGDAHAAASASDGSVGAALEGATDAFAEARDAAIGLLRDLSKGGDPRRRLEGAKSLTGGGRVGLDRDELGRRLRALSSMLRDMAAIQAGVGERDLANADLAPTLQGLLRAFEGDRLVRAFDAVDEALEALDRNASPKIVADWVAFQV